MKRLVWLWLCVVVCALGEGRIIKLVPFGEHNLKIVFDRDISALKWDSKTLPDSRAFVDMEADLTIPRRHFIFKDNSTLQIAQNTPKIVRLVITTAPKSRFELIKEKENLYVFFKPKDLEKSKSQANSKADSKDSKGGKESKGVKDSKDSKPTKESKEASKDSQNETKQAPLESTERTPKIAGKKKIVVDAGHGGKDCGTRSVEGVCEKMIVLEVAKLLSSELKSRGYVVYMTRSSDVYIDLRKRTEFANAKNADLFVSIHANSMPKDSPKTPSGVETYFLSPARSERAEQVAKAENQGDIETMSHFATKSFLNTISAFHLVASHKLAIEIQSSILSQVRQKHDTHDGAVREGPFWVLAGALMPSVLIEIGYASHKDEGKLIATKDYQKLLSQGIANGIDGYFLRNY